MSDLASMMKTLEKESTKKAKTRSSIKSPVDQDATVEPYTREEIMANYHARPPLLSDDFWDAWDALAPSVGSVFKARKWTSMNGHWKIVKRNIESLRGTHDSLDKFERGA